MVKGINSVLFEKKIIFGFLITCTRDSDVKGKSLYLKSFEKV